MAENASWKKIGDVYKTNGEILKIGTFVDSSGKTVPINDEDLEDLFNGVSEYIPMGISHNPNDPHYVETLGYAIKVARSNDVISHDGIVFDSKNFDDVILNGYNNISPELEYIRDPSTGKVVSKKITRLAFVNNPSIESNKTNITRFAFSAPEVSIEVQNMPDTTPNNITSTTPEQPVFDGNQWKNAPPVEKPAVDMTELMKNMAESITNGITSKMSAQIEALQSEINALKTVEKPPIEEPIVEKPAETSPEQTLPPEVLNQLAEIQKINAELKARVEKEEKQRYTDKLAELRSLGQANPEKLVSHLSTYEQKIATLDALKTAIVKNTPVNSENTTPMSQEGGITPEKVTVASLADSWRMNMSEEEAEFIAKRLRIPMK